MNRNVRIVFLCAVTVAGMSGQVNNNAGSLGTTLTMTGTVMIDDGTALPGRANIQMVCGGAEQTVGRSMPAGDFGFQWNTAPGNSLTLSSSFNPRAFPQGQSVNCNLRAELAGFTSATVNMANPQRFEGYDVGVIWLHKISGAAGGNMVSASTLRAPRGALKDFDKGNRLMMAGRVSEATAAYSKATAAYPGFAEAWMNMGRAQYRMGSNEAAVASSLKAVALDSKTVEAWQVLGFIAADDKDWKSAAHYLDQAERLDPLRSVLTWYYSAVAYYELGQLGDAERSIRTAMNLDPQVQNRRAQYVLGLILIAKHDVDGGAEMLRGYLALSPDARDVAPANALLRRLQAVASGPIASK